VLLNLFKTKAISEVEYFGWLEREEYRKAQLVAKSLSECVVSVTRELAELWDRLSDRFSHLRMHSAMELREGFLKRIEGGQEKKRVSIFDVPSAEQEKMDCKACHKKSKAEKNLYFY